MLGHLVSFAHFRVNTSSIVAPFLDYSTYSKAADYGYSLRRLAQKAYPTLRYTDIEPTLIDGFLNGLNNQELKKHVQFHHPQTLNQAFAFASEYEAFVGPLDKVVKPSNMA
jgi:hypothetical protein